MQFYRPPRTLALEKRYLTRIRKILREGAFINGPEVAEFEKKVTTYLKTPFLSCNSGTDALMIGLKALGIGKGDEVITPAFTFFATLEAIHHVGATPVFADIDIATFNIDPEDVRKRITKKTKAILPVHLFGLPADMTAIMAIARTHKLLVIEDAAQSFGAKHAGKMSGTIGDMGTFSFFPTKNLGGFGDGGGIATRDPEVLLRFKKLKSHGGLSKYANEEMGYNSRLDTLHAGLLIERMSIMRAELATRTKAAAAWRKKLAKHPLVEQLPDQKGHTYNQFSILVSDRATFVKELSAEGIPHMIYYPTPLYRQKAYTKHHGKHAPLPNTEYVTERIVSLPILSA